MERMPRCLPVGRHDAPLPWVAAALAPALPGMELIEELDQWRITHMPLRSRSQAIARLLAEGMVAEKEEPDG